MSTTYKILIVFAAWALLTSNDSFAASQQAGGGSMGWAQHPTQHSVTLVWVPSASLEVAGYRIYRGVGNGGPYQLLNTDLITVPTYTDSTVESGETYYYVATAVDANNGESEYSNETEAQIPLR